MPGMKAKRASESRKARSGSLRTAYASDQALRLADAPGGNIAFPPDIACNTV